MEAKDIPPTALVGGCSKNNKSGLECLLGHARDLMKGRTFVHCEIIHGANRSGHLLTQEIIPGFATGNLPEPASPVEIATRLLSPDTIQKAQYDTDTPPIEYSFRGFEVRNGELQGKRIVIVWAAWVAG